MYKSDRQEAGRGFLNMHLIRLIETNSENLANGLWSRIGNSLRLREYRDRVPKEELRQRAYEIYRNLGEWLQNKSENDVEHRYVAVGERRAEQGVPLSQLALAIFATKEHLWEHITDEALTDRAIDLLQMLELSRSVEKFFDRAVYFATIGYERYGAAHRATAAGTCAIKS
jgi:hypothetical protein